MTDTTDKPKSWRYYCTPFDDPDKLNWECPDCNGGLDRDGYCLACWAETLEPDQCIDHFGSEEDE